MSRVIVCKMGRLGDLIKLVDCPLQELRDGPEEVRPANLTDIYI